MKGLELSEAFYNEYGKPMLEKEFPTLLPRVAVGLVGEAMRQSILKKAFEGKL